MRTNLTDEAKYAYAAGVIDGEGCFSITEHKDCIQARYYTQIVVNNTNERLIKWLASTFGGYAGEIKNINPKWKTCYRWALRTDETATFIGKVYPYLLIKLEQAQTMLFFLNRDTLDLGKVWYDKMKELNKKGRE